MFTVTERASMDKLRRRLAELRQITEAQWVLYRVTCTCTHCQRFYGARVFPCAKMLRRGG